MIRAYKLIMTHHILIFDHIDLSMIVLAKCPYFFSSTRAPILLGGKQ